MMELKQIKAPYSEISIEKSEFLLKMKKYIREGWNISQSSGIMVRIDEKSVVRQISLSMPEKIEVEGFIKLIHKIPDFFPDLYSLGLDIYGLKSLPKSFNNLSKLKRMEIGYQLEKIDEGLFTNIPDLKKLTIEGVFTSIPNSIGKLLSIKQLAIINSPNLQYLPDSIVNLTNLSSFRIRNVPLISLPFSIEKLRNLEELNLNDVGIEFLPESIGECSKLSKIDIRSCFDLQTLPDSIGNLSNLKELNIFGCHSLKTLPESIVKLEALEQLYLVDCPNLEGTLKIQKGLSRIKRVSIDHCGKGWIIDKVRFL